jgi:hypothetical protein
MTTDATSDSIERTQDVKALEDAVWRARERAEQAMAAQVAAQAELNRRKTEAEEAGDAVHLAWAAWSQAAEAAWKAAQESAL